MTRSELVKLKREKLNKYPYSMTYFAEWNYGLLKNIMYIKRAGRGSNDSYNEVLIMFDTETSKSHFDTFDIEGKCEKNNNYVVAWTISIRAYERNIVTLYGNNPGELVETLTLIHNEMYGDKTVFYVHNLSYDWVFVRKFIFEKWGFPCKQLNTKPHYPIYIEFDNGIIIKDSLILAQRSLEKWGNDLEVEHTKASGKWNYDEIRHQHHKFTKDELEYIEHDTLCGVECLNKLMTQLNKKIYSMPYTATGIPREETRKRGNENNAKDRFMRQVLSYDLYNMILKVFHGGYTHGNRHFLSLLLNDVEGWDKSSSYPSVVLTKKFPCEKFTKIEASIDDILKNMEEYAFIFKLTLVRPRLKNDDIPMPVLQFSKCTKTLDAINDNGRVLCAEFVEIYLTEIDLLTIIEQYDYDFADIDECYWALKDYLPRWFTDYIYELYRDKTMLKGRDNVLYNLQKAKLNAASFGMMVQKPLRDSPIEDYITGEYTIESQSSEEDYEKYINKRTSILLYQHGVYVTAWGVRMLHLLGACIDYENGGQWLYSDTDSVYGIGWDKEKLKQYNDMCLNELLQNGYNPIEWNGKTYIPGVAELDGTYSEFRYLGAKRYCGRSKEDDKLHITVAGVPKKGVECLRDDIQNFKDGVIFDGETSGKKQHQINVVDKIYTNEYGDLIGDSINLSPCNYLMTAVTPTNWIDEFEEREIEVQVYE